MDILSIDEYKKRFSGFGIRDCAVETRGIFYLVKLQDWDNSKPRPFEEELETRLTRLELQGEPQWRTVKLDGFSGLMACGQLIPEATCICVDRGGQVCNKGVGPVEIENNIPGGLGKGPSRGAVTSLKKIDGWLYGCDSSRSLFKRVDRNQWVEIGPLPSAKKGRSGFDDFDAFSETDIYAAGGKGDVWHYDGKAWHAVPFPSNMWIESVCCGQDGYVYIGAQSGSVFRGRSNEWKLIHKGDLSLPFKDMVWFGDRIYATNDYGLWEIKDGVVAASNTPIEITNCSGNLSVGDGVMLLAGHYGA
ncbi:hypothetical protein, partial [Ralstonia solanacearum]